MSRGRPAVLILAGGRAARMGGGDKGLRIFGNRTLLEHVIDRMAGQGSLMLLNANGDPARFARFGLPVLPDTVTGQPGPLAGVLAGLEWVAVHRPELADLVTVPTDTPCLPLDLVARLVAAREAAGAEIACAASSGHIHPVVALWPARLHAALRTALVDEQIRRVTAWMARFRWVKVPFAVADTDPFLNANRVGDLDWSRA